MTHSSNNYGSCQHSEKLIPRVVGHALAGEQVPVFGDGQNVLDCLYFWDHSQRVLVTLEREMLGVAYNLVELYEKTNMQVDGAILSHLRLSEDRIELVEDRSGHDRRCAVDPRRASEELEWKAVPGFDQGLVKIVTWHLEHREWWGDTEDLRSSYGRRGKSGARSMDLAIGEFLAKR